MTSYQSWSDQLRLSPISTGRHSILNSHCSVGSVVHSCLSRRPLFFFLFLFFVLFCKLEDYKSRILSSHSLDVIAPISTGCPSISNSYCLDGSIVHSSLSRHLWFVFFFCSLFCFASWKTRSLEFFSLMALL